MFDDEIKISSYPYWIGLLLIWAILFKSYTPVDLFGYIIYGEWIIKNLTIPHSDIYSFTAYNTPWINHEWLFHLLVGLLYKFSGWVGLQFLLFLMVGFIVLLLGIQVFDKRNDNSNYTFPLLLAYLSLFPGMTLRPQLMTFLFLIFLIPRLLRSSIETVDFALIPLIFLLWANLHGGFIFGLAIMGALLPYRYLQFSVNEALKLLLLLAVSVAVTLLNPYGIDLWRMIISTISEPMTAQFIEEWQPIWSSPYHAVVWFLLTSYVAYVYILNRHFHSLSRTSRYLPIIMIALLALWPKRNLAVYGPSVVLILDSPNGILKKFRVGEWFASRRSEVKVGVMVGIVLASMYLFFNEFNGGFRSGEINYPDDLVKTVNQYNESKRALVHYPWAEWWLFRVEDTRVFLDGRWTTVYPKSVISDYVRAILGETTILQKYGVNWILLPKKYHLNGKLSRLHQWRKIGTDEGAYLWRRESISLAQDETDRRLE